MHRSELGKPLPDDFTFEFNPLWQMSDVDRSTVAVNTTNAISTALGDGLMTRKAAMTDLRENSDVTGIGASITDEDIENAEDEAPPCIGELGDKPPESRAEIRYRTSLRQIARAVGDIVNGRYDGSNDSVTEIMDALERYSEIITPGRRRLLRTLPPTLHARMKSSGVSTAGTSAQSCATWSTAPR